MRRVSIVLALLLAALFFLLMPIAALAAQTWPVKEGMSFNNDTGAPLKVVMCNPDGTGCSAVFTFSAGAMYINCGYWNFSMPKPPGNTYPRICKLATTTPPPPAPPSAPTNLAAVVGDRAVSLAWSASTGAATYKVRRSTTSGGPYAVLATITTTSYADVAVTNDTAYFYVVSAVSAAGAESGNSAQVAATPSLPLQAFTVCLPAFRADYWNLYKIFDTPPSVSTRYPQLVTWKGKPECNANGVISGQFYNYAEMAQFVAMAFMTDEAANAWVKSQPIVRLTEPEKQWQLAKREEYARMLQAAGTN